MKLKLTAYDKKRTSHYPIEQAVLVPSTVYGNKPISRTAHKKRINEVKRFLSNKFGGFTSVSAKGGYYSKDKNKVIQEDVAVVTSFSSKGKYRRGISDLKRQLRRWNKKWKQESMGYTHEGDLYYFR